MKLKNLCIIGISMCILCSCSSNDTVETSTNITNTITNTPIVTQETTPTIVEDKIEDIEVTVTENPDEPKQSEGTVSIEAFKLIDLNTIDYTKSVVASIKQTTHGISESNNEFTNIVDIDIEGDIANNHIISKINSDFYENNEEIIETYTTFDEENNQYIEYYNFRDSGWCLLNNATPTYTFIESIWPNLDMFKVLDISDTTDTEIIVEGIIDLSETKLVNLVDIFNTDSIQISDTETIKSTSEEANIKLIFDKETSLLKSYIIDITKCDEFDNGSLDSWTIEVNIHECSDQKFIIPQEVIDEATEEYNRLLDIINNYEYIDYSNDLDNPNIVDTISEIYELENVDIKYKSMYLTSEYQNTYIEPTNQLCILTFTITNNDSNDILVNLKDIVMDYTIYCTNNNVFGPVNTKENDIQNVNVTLEPNSSIDVNLVFSINKEDSPIKVKIENPSNEKYIYIDDFTSVSDEINDTLEEVNDTLNDTLNDTNNDNLDTENDENNEKDMIIPPHLYDNLVSNDTSSIGVNYLDISLQEVTDLDDLISQCQEWVIFTTDIEDDSIELVNKDNLVLEIGEYELIWSSTLSNLTCSQMITITE